MFNRSGYAGLNSGNIVNFDAFIWAAGDAANHTMIRYTATEFSPGSGISEFIGSAGQNAAEANDKFRIKLFAADGRDYNQGAVYLYRMGEAT